MSEYIFFGTAAVVYLIAFGVTAFVVMLAIIIRGGTMDQKDEWYD